MSASTSAGLAAVPAPATLPVPTFTRDVAPIFYQHCTGCHRLGQIAPMSLLTFKDARPWSRAIRARVANRTMPPWFAEDGHRPLAHPGQLNDNELMTILAWVDGGAVEGNPSDLTPEPAYVRDDWQIGAPDAVFALPADVAIPATGAVEVQYFEVPTNFREDRWIQAIEIRPGDVAHVHHAIVHERGTRPVAGGSPADETPSADGALAIYASGTDPLVFPSGTARRISAGAVLVFEMHYTTNGTPARDRTKVALRFAERPPALDVHSIAISTDDFTIPPGEAGHQVRTAIPLDGPLSILSIMPHAHRRGRAYQYRLLFPDGRAETILAVSRFNWLWERAYTFATPVAVPAGTSIEVVGTFDNSAGNKANPDPKSAVRSGWDPTTSEMMFSYIVFAMPRRE